MTRREIVLVGGGHAHVLAMTALAARPMPGLRLTLVAEHAQTPYSGMLPGHIAGFYRRDEMHIDLVGLARATGARLVLAQAEGLDAAEKRVKLRGRPDLRYDLLSLNVGIVPDLSDVAGAEAHGVAVKPISHFLAKLDALLDTARRRDGPRRIAIVGGGAAGVELAFALRARLRREAQAAGIDEAAFAVTLVSAATLLPSLNRRVRRRVEARLAAQNIDVVTDFRAASLDGRSLTAHGGAVLPTDATLFSTAARAPSWLAGAGLPLAPDGSVLTRATLQTCGDDAVFAVGDCGSIEGQARPKAGVFAVRQGPVLARNLMALATGRPLEEHRPQRDHLTLLMTGDGGAIAGRGSWFALEGPLVWLWKDWIDRRFMARFQGACHDSP